MEICAETENQGSETWPCPYPEQERCPPGGGDQAGIWVTRQYKLGRPNSTTRFVCLSGMGRDADVTRICKDAGFAPPFSLGKPVKWDEMKDLLATLYL